MSQEFDIHAEFKKVVGELERIATLPTEIATVVEVNGQHVQVAGGRGSFSLKRPMAVLKKGDRILINAESKQYVEHSPFQCQSRLISFVADVQDDMAVIEQNGVKKLVPVNCAVEPGDQVYLDEHASIIMAVIPPKEPKVLDTGVTWDDVGGNKEAKLVLIDAIENAYKHADLYAHYGAKPTSGILMVGPPGCGKTMLAKAAATSIGSEDGFIAVKGPEVLSVWVGAAEASVRSLFSRARQYKAKTGRRAVIFIDEAEAILGDRNANYAQMEKTIVPTFLTEMDGLEESAATVILATNRGMNLDSAVVRPGRVDQKVLITRPNADESAEILLTYLRKTPCQEAVEELAQKTVISLWSMSFENGGTRHAASDHVSGSLLANVIEQARHSAMRRDIAESTMSGIGLRDIGYGLVNVVKGLQLVALDTHYN